MTCLAAAMLLAPGPARADVVLTATLPPFDPPLANAISRAEPSTLTVLVTNTGSQIVREVDLQLPPQYGAVTSSSGPADGTWTATRAGGVAYFRANCSGPGLPPNDSASFVIGFTGSSTTNNGDNPASSPFTVTGLTSSGSNVCDPSPASDSTTFTAPVKALYISGTVTVNSSTQATVTWTVVNNNNSWTVNNVAIDAVVTPGTGWTLQPGTCGAISSIVAGSSAQRTCVYTFQTPGTYAFMASARDANGTGSSSAAGNTTEPFTSGSVPSVTWTNPIVVTKGLTTNTFTLSVGAPGAASVTQIDIINDNSPGCASSSWTLVSGSATRLTYQGTSTAADVVFKGTLNAGLSTDIVVNWSAVPNLSAGQYCSFSVKVAYTGGPTTVSRQVWLDVPILDVSQFTIRNDSTGKLLQWTNTERTDAPHDGVVIFREPAGTAPALPVQQKQYTVGENRVVFATSGDDDRHEFLDTTPDGFNYRICNHDAHFVYSSCSTGGANDGGYLSSEVYPAGGWVAALGGDASTRVGLLPGNQLVGQASNTPAMNILDVTTGLPQFAPVALPSLPSVNSPAIPLQDGTTAIFAADQSGYVTAVDIHSGALKWPAFHAAVNFAAGMTAIIASGAAPQFRTDYQTDVLFVGSTTGTVYAIDALTGQELWNLSVGTGIYGLIIYDWNTNYLLVPTQGSGVVAYDLNNTRKGVRPGLASAWNGADITNLNLRNCVLTAWAEALACITTNGRLWVVDMTNGKRLAPILNTSLSAAPTLARVSTSNPAGWGFVVTSGRTAKVYKWKKGDNTITQIGSNWLCPTSGATISPAAVSGDRGYFVVGANDKRLYRVSLTTGTLLSQSPQITSQLATPLLARPAYDAINNRFLFGTSDGHLWAIPYF